MGIPQTDRDWIESVCRQLSRVTGWPTSFVPVDAHPSPLPGEYHWSCELHTLRGEVGSLVVALPPDRPLDEAFLRACEYADLSAQLIGRVLSEKSPQPRLQGPTGKTDHHGGDEAANAWTLAARRVLDVGLRITGFRAAVLFVLDPEAGRLRMRAQRTADRQTVMLFGRPLDQAPFDLAALQNKSVVIRRRHGEFSEWLPDGMSLGVCRGIRTTYGVQGTLWVFDRRDRRLTSREEVVLESISARLAELIEQAHQIEEGALQRRLRAELRIAAESQPDQRLCLQGTGGWCHVAGRTESAREVGGDLCEVIPLADERMLVAVGDAAGHSIPAAMVMSTVRGALRVIVDPHDPESTSPDKILARLNGVLHGIVEAHQFMTLTCAILNARTETLQLCSAGHPPALLLRDGKVQSLEAHGLLLGVVDDAVYQSLSIPLQPGDLLALYSDGISEARARGQELFRSQGIASILTSHAGLRPEPIVDQVWSALQSHIETGQPDDRTLLLIRYDGITEPGQPPGEPEAIASGCLEPA